MSQCIGKQLLRALEGTATRKRDRSNSASSVDSAVSDVSSRVSSTSMKVKRSKLDEVNDDLKAKILNHLQNYDGIKVQSGENICER